MKKIYIAFAVLAAAALTSCVHEKSFNDRTAGENEVAFVLQGISTRSAEEALPARKGAKMEFDVDKYGQKFYFDETVQDLNGFMPATKGSPVYTENVGKLYKNQLSVTAFNSSTDARIFLDQDFENLDEEMYENSGGWRYYRNFDYDPWPDLDTPVNFYLRMPSTMTNVTMDATAPYDGGKFKFGYVSPTTAADQQDIIFAYTSINKKDHRDNLPEGTPVVFQHALTAVKFAIKNYDAENNVTIKSITISGLVGEGTCVLDPNATAKTDRVKWTLPEEPDITAKYASGDFGIPVDFKKKADGGGSFTNNGDFPDSFAAAGNLQNLNDGDASQTFWFIPQAVTDKVTLTISYTYGSTEVRTGVLDFGEVLSAYDTYWDAGELRTYTIKVDEVNVRIMDDVTIQGSDETGYATSYKDNIIITNTGNTKAFIRAAIVGQWLDYLDRPVFGFTDKVNQLYLVESWYEDQFVNKGRDQGLFVGLPGYNGNGDNPLRDWTLCEDGYYYYTVVVPPLTDVTDPAKANTTALFTSYTVGRIPNTQIAGQNIDHKEMHFRLEIATQAISAVKIDGKEGSLYTWQEAWENATGIRPVIKGANTNSNSGN